MAKYYVDEIESRPRKVTVKPLVWQTTNGSVFENDIHPVNIVLRGNKYHVHVRGVNVKGFNSLEQAIGYVHNYHVKTQTN